MRCPRRALSASLLVLAGCQADLRPEPLQERVEAAHEERGRAALARAERALIGQGVAPWKSQTGVEVHLTDTFSGLVGSAVSPWPDDPQTLTFRFLPGRDSAVADLETDPPLTVGIHRGKTWRREGDGGVEYDDDGDVVFWLPTLQYFLELPFRLLEAEIVDYAGEADWGGVACERVYATWGSYAPHDVFDQYLAWVRRDDGRMVRVDFTVRDKFDFLVGTVVYEDYREVGGYLLPHRILIGPEPPDDLLHSYQVHEYRLNVDLPGSVYAPK